MATRNQKRGPDGRFGSGIRVRGFVRLNIVEHAEDDGAPRIVGDTGWIENVILNTGKVQYLAMALAGSAGSKFVSKMAIGSGTLPATSDTSLHGEFAQMTGASSTRNRQNVTPTTGLSGATATVQYAATWASSYTGTPPGFVTAASTLANIGLHWSENAAGTMFAGVTFNSSLLNTNQDVQASYVISFV